MGFYLFRWDVEDTRFKQRPPTLIPLYMTTSPKSLNL